MSTPQGCPVPIAIARARLTEFVEQQARATARRLGFGWTPDPTGPNTYPALQAAFARSLDGGAPLPVSSLHNDSIVYDQPSANLAMRFWHDVHHVELSLSFDLVDELELALWHLNVLVEAGHGEGGLVWQLLHADLIGQAYFMGLTRQFPDDQRRFVDGCLHGGFDQGLLREARRLPRADQ